jgi:hypothetical protein
MKIACKIGIVALIVIAAAIGTQIPSEQKREQSSEPVSAPRAKEPEAKPQPETQSPRDNAAPSDSELTAKASLSIIGACTGWQLGTVERSQIMNTAKELFSRQGYDPSSVNWDRAIEVAVQLDKEKNLGCLQ